MATTYNLGRVQGASIFYTAQSSSTSVPITALQPSDIKPFVGDHIFFRNGDVREILSFAGTTSSNSAVCGSVLVNLVGDDGVSIQDVTQTTTSSDDGGYNIVTITKTDGSKSTIRIKNGSTGESAGFGTPTASVDTGVGTPSVSVTASGKDTAKVFDFKFKNLKGVGISSVTQTATSTADGGTNTMKVTLTNGNSTYFNVRNGSKGSTGRDGATGPQGPKGEDGNDGANGVTFTPIVSDEGVLSWTNDGGLDNPTSVNIKGEKGDAPDLTGYATKEYVDEVIGSIEAGGTTDYNELNNAPIINKDLANDGYRAVNPFQIGDEVTRIYFNKNVEPNLGLLELKYSEVQFIKNILTFGGRASGGEGNKVKVVKIIDKGETITLDDGTKYTFKQDQLYIVVFNSGGSAVYVYCSTEYATLFNTAVGQDVLPLGWVDSDYIDVTFGHALTEIGSNSGIWNSWISKDGLWETGSTYYGDSDIYYRHTGETTNDVVPSSPIKEGDKITGLYFDTSYTPDLSKILKCVPESISGRYNNKEDILSEKYSDGTYIFYRTLLALYAYKLDGDVEPSYALTIGKGSNEFPLKIVYAQNLTEEAVTSMGLSAYEWKENGWLIDSPYVSIPTLNAVKRYIPLDGTYGQDVWGRYISKTGVWTHSFDKGELYFFDGKNYVKVNNDAYSKDEVYTRVEVDAKIEEQSAQITDVQNSIITDYDNLSNIPIVAQDLTETHTYAETNPIKYGDHLSTIYFNKDAIIDFAKLDWTHSIAWAEFVDCMVLLEGDTHELLRAYKTMSEKSSSIDSYELRVWDAGNWKMVADSRSGWLMDSTSIGPATIRGISQQDVWGGWISKDGQWMLVGNYDGEYGTYYRHTGSTTEDFTNGKIYYYDGEYNAMADGSETKELKAADSALDARVTALESAGGSITLNRYSVNIDKSNSGLLYKICQQAKGRVGINCDGVPMDVVPNGENFVCRGYTTSFISSYPDNVSGVVDNMEATLTKSSFTVKYKPFAISYDENGNAKLAYREILSMNSFVTVTYYNDTEITE